MPDTNIEAAQQTKTGKYDQRDPQDAPMNRKLPRNHCAVPLIAPLLAECKRERQHQQSEKGEGRFQHEQNRKIEPDTVPIGVTQDERLPASSSQHHQHSSQVQPGRHEQPTQRHCGGAMAETVKHIACLMQGKDEIKQVDGKRSPENALESGAPAEPPPSSRRSFADSLARHSTPARAQSKGDKDKEQNPRGEFRKKRSRQAQPKQDVIFSAGVLPYSREAPQRQLSEQCDWYVSMDERAKRKKGRGTDVNAQAKQPAPIASQAPCVDKQHPAQHQREKQHGQAGPRQHGCRVVPFCEEIFPEYPLPQKSGDELVAHLPRNVGIIRANSA